MLRIWYSQKREKRKLQFLQRQKRISCILVPKKRRNLQRTECQQTIMQKRNAMQQTVQLGMREKTRGCCQNYITFAIFCLRVCEFYSFSFHYKFFKFYSKIELTSGSYSQKNVWKTKQNFHHSQILPRIKQPALLCNLKTPEKLNERESHR